MRVPLDREDRNIIGSILAAAFLILFASAVLGLAVRLFLFLAFGGN